MRKSKNYFNKNRNYEHWCKFKTQRNFYQNLLRKKKRTISAIQMLVTKLITKVFRSLQNLISVTRG